MARNDGIDRTFARNGKYARSQIINIERHNERKNESYENKDIELERSDLNIYFKKPTAGYLTTFDRMCENGTISTKGHRADAIIIDEILCDVNTAYFEKHGGYDYAKEFFTRAYDFAVKEAGGAQYILSAVMHADERNKALSEKLGKDVYHYHLHVVYVPVVQKEVKWTKRCKDKSLVGTVKEVITQVSHSKKWASHKAIGNDGKSHLIPSYSLLQDRFFEYMRDCGYKDVERGEKGSTEENLSTTEFKVMQEENKLAEAQKLLSKIKDAKTKIQAIDDIETKSPLMDKSKIVIDKSDFDELKTLAKKQIVLVNKEKKLLANNKKLQSENQQLKQVNSVQNKELFEFKSVKNKMNVGKLQAEVDRLQKIVDKVMTFIESLGLKAQLDKFLRKSKENER